MKRILALLAALALATGALAAVTSNSIVTPQTPTRGIVQFLQGTDVAGTYKTIYTAGANGSKCNSLFLTSTDATSHLITVQLVNGGVRYGGMSINTGTTTPGFASGAPPINAMSAANWPGLPLDSDGNPYVMLASGDTLQATFATALTAATVVNAISSCADF